MVPGRYTAFCTLLFAATLSAAAPADEKGITFFNTTGRAIWVEFWGKAQCVDPAPKQGSFPVGVNDDRTFPINLKPDCGDSSIEFTLAMITGNSEHPEVGGTVTYRRYRGLNKGWLQKVEFTPTPGVNFFNFIQAFCGSTPQVCKGTGIPFTDAQAEVRVLNPGLIVTNRYIGPGKSR
ncbi:hypothetical protein [Bordetella bronchialis]|uniref:hypothetical protein n=1 Tax=Bordetella bronchialis TaxID=463025 RepID=UPI000A6A0EAF|nr:hypothetical protein [Bordetella bronchialis]